MHYAATYTMYVLIIMTFCSVCCGVVLCVCAFVRAWVCATNCIITCACILLHYFATFCISVALPVSRSLSVPLSHFRHPRSAGCLQACTHQCSAVGTTNAAPIINHVARFAEQADKDPNAQVSYCCLLYTSDAADE